MQQPTEKVPTPTTRRLVGGYIWQDELSDIAADSERVAEELTELSQAAPTVSATRHLAKLATLSMRSALKAMRLQSYRQEKMTA